MCGYCPARQDQLQQLPQDHRYLCVANCEVLKAVAESAQEDKDESAAEQINSMRNNSILPVQEDETFTDYIKRLLSLAPAEKFYSPFYNNFKLKKVKNVVKSYAANVNLDELVLQMDSPVFGNGKEGLLITLNEVYYRSFDKKAGVAAVNDISGFEEDQTEKTCIRMILNDGMTAAFLAIRPQDSALVLNAVLYVLHQVNRSAQ